MNKVAKLTPSYYLKAIIILITTRGNYINYEMFHFVPAQHKNPISHFDPMFILYKFS